jgi:hypothetical protein
MTGSPNLPTLCGVFVWRQGRWLVQTTNDAALKPLEKRLSRHIEKLKGLGQLLEVSPGCYTISSTAAQPLLNHSESPLTRLFNLRQPNGGAIIDIEQWQAGERLRRDYERGQLSQRITAQYSADAGATHGQTRWSDNAIADLQDNTIAARDRLHRALDAVGPELSGILLQVCCLSAGLEQAEMQLELPRRAGKAVLQLALTRLARHYGIKPSLRHKGPTHIGQWAMADFKPQIVPQPQHLP